FCRSLTFVVSTSPTRRAYNVNINGNQNCNGPTILKLRRVNLSFIYHLRHLSNTQVFLNH
ncbi:MAG: hypothetical protein AAFN81_26950, partial [Bacteroidota bacterium]